ncbi:MAG: sulfatase-like hydrolase/transferase [Sedimentisphaerales bacterium]|nr:sulfatase-like hydrolase/transferase [Sedimentisphaerales bacterium]
MKYTRRTFLEMAGFSITAAGLGKPACFAQTTRSAGRRPNLVLIMADDLGYECLGCYGSTSYRTPILDELARTGMRFDHCYSQPLCTPSRVQIMTGQYNFRNYLDFGILDREETTFGHVLQRAGYATCVVGKWQLFGRDNNKPGIAGRGTTPKQAGFDEHCLWQVDRRESRYRDPLIVENGTYRDDLKGKYGPDIFCEYALDFIERKKDVPFLLYFPMALVHSPFVPTPDSAEWAEGKEKANKKHFADMVAYMDKIVGRIVARLDECNLRQDTLILFTGDNGTGRGIRSQLGDRVVAGGKGQTTDGGTHVPFVANWKSVMPAGKVCDDLIDFTDFLPTLAEAAQTKLPANLPVDGRSFLPQLRGKKGNPREWIFCHYFRNAGNPPKRFARDKRWKLYQSGALFDIPSDPLEEHPVPPDTRNAQAAAARARLQVVLDSLQ